MPLKSERRGHVVILTLERPEVRNAFDAALSVALYDALTEIDADDGVRAVVLTGAGDESFSSGADLKVLAQGDPSDTGRGISLVHICRQSWAKPLIAATRSTLSSHASSSACVKRACTIAPSRWLPSSPRTDAV